MQRRGLLLDRAAKNQYRRRVRTELRQCDELARREADAAGFKYTDKFPNSSRQVGNLLFEHLKLRGGKKTPSGAHWSGDQDALNRALKQLRKRDEPYRKLLHALFHRARLETIDTRYLTVQPDDDGRVRATVKMLHAKTMRYAYESPALQQFPEEARHIFVAPPGHVYVAADFSQLEARIMAYLARDSISIGVFESGGDPHVQNARDLFGWSEQEWADLDPKTRKNARVFAKTFLYRKMYGGTIASGDQKLFCPCTEWGCAAKKPSTATLKASEVIAAELRWARAHPAVERFQRRVAAQVRDTHYWRPPLGGRRWIAKPWGRELERELANIPMQTTAAQIMNRAQVMLEEADVPLVMQLHDSFLACVPDFEAEEVADTMRAIMEAPVPELGTSFPVDIAIGYNWGDYHPTDNPEGLRECNPET
jgi:DNA polymerase-1